MRKIKFKLLTQTQLEVLETSARTFGELKVDMANHPVLSKIDFSNNQLIERATKAAYQNIDAAILPPVDCIMFQTATKTASGCDLPTVESLEEMSYNELRSLGSKLNKENNANIDLSGKRVDILERVAEYIKSQEIWDNAEYVPTVTHAVTLLKEAVNILENWQQDVEKVELVESLTLEDLEEESKEIQKLVLKK